MAELVARRLACKLLAMTCPSEVLGQVLTGGATAVDGDTLNVNGQGVRLFGVDAPELDQTCVSEGSPWRCGDQAKQRLHELVSGQREDCEINGTDQYGRSVAKCFTQFMPLNEAMVELGWAVAYREYSNDYVEAEERAKLRKAGIWGSTFTMPAEHRLANVPKKPLQSRPAPTRPTSQQSNQSVSGCSIKGNRNRKGQWIYHLPGMPYYDRTWAEEFFCSEAQARAAGYRRAIVH